MKENILLCVKLSLIALLLAIVVYLSTIVWQIALACISILIVILLLFRYFEFPYKIIIKIFGNDDDKDKTEYAMIVHPWKKKIIKYIEENAVVNQKILKHEQQHLNQIEKDGSWKFVIKYLFYLLKYGYTNNPYEVEARKAEV